MWAGKKKKNTICLCFITTEPENSSYPYPICWNTFTRLVGILSSMFSTLLRTCAEIWLSYKTEKFPLCVLSRYLLEDVSWNLRKCVLYWTTPASSESIKSVPSFQTYKKYRWLSLTPPPPIPERRKRLPPPVLWTISLATRRKKSKKESENEEAAWMRIGIQKQMQEAQFVRVRPRNRNRGNHTMENEEVILDNFVDNINFCLIQALCRLFIFCVLDAFWHSLWRVAASLRSFSTPNPYPPDFKAKDEDGETLGHQLVFNLCNCCCLHLSTWCQLAGAGTPAEARALSEIQVCSWSPHVPSISTVLCDRRTLELQAEVPWAWPRPRTSHVSQERGEPI